LREIAESNRRRLAYRLQAWLQLLFPAAIVSFGLVVGLLFVSFFLPIVALIQKFELVGQAFQPDADSLVFLSGWKA